MVSDQDKARRVLFAAWFNGRGMQGDRKVFMERTGYSKGRVAQLLDPSEPFGERTARTIARKLGLPLHTFLLGKPALELVTRTTEGVAQLPSLESLSDALPKVTWEGLMTKVPETKFILPLRDDALAPRYLKGLSIVWNPVRAPAPGRLVLIRDNHGALHARICQQGPGGTGWVAAAVHADYATFSADDTELIAVHQGFLEPDD